MEKQENRGRKFSKKEMLEILNEAKVHGVKVMFPKKSRAEIPKKG